jgi:eukaryotic-like serine/threonine-protein kinase
LKPGNVLFDLEGRAKIADFGIARIGGANTITEAGVVLGTAAYISPEQAAGEPAVPASDVYSFGVLLYRLLSGRLPFEAQSPVELAAMHRDADVPPLASIRPDAPASLARLAMSALAKSPEARPADGAALLDVLDFGQRERIGSEDETQVVDARPPKRRLSKPLIAGGSLALLTITGFLGALLLTNEPASAPAVPNRDSRSHSTRQASSTEATSRESSSRSTSSQAATTAPATSASRSTVGMTTTVPPPTTPGETTSELTVPSSTATLPTSTATP